MKTQKKYVALKKKKSEKIELEIPSILIFFLALVFKKRFEGINQSDDELTLFPIPNWLFHLLEIFSFCYKGIKSISFIIWILTFLIGIIVSLYYFL